MSDFEDGRTDGPPSDEELERRLRDHASLIRRQEVAAARLDPVFRHQLRMQLTGEEAPAPDPTFVQTLRERLTRRGARPVARRRTRRSPTATPSASPRRQRHSPDPDRRRTTVAVTIGTTAPSATGHASPRRAWTARTAGATSSPARSGEPPTPDQDRPGRAASPATRPTPAVPHPRPTPPTPRSPPAGTPPAGERRSADPWPPRPRHGGRV